MPSRFRIWLPVLLAGLAACARTNVFAPVAATVSVSPATVTVALGRSQRFTATTVPPGRAVTWSVELPNAGTITKDGIYTAPAAFSGGAAKETVDVVAALAGDPQVTGIAKVTIVPLANGPAAKLVVVSGDAQSAPAQTQVALPFVVEAEDAQGSGVEGVPVVFAAPDGTSTDAVTDASGLAQAQPTTPTQAGPATYTASSEGLGAVTFTVTVVPGPLARLVATHPHPTGHTGETLADPLVLTFTDAFGNPLANESATVQPAEGANAVALTAASASDGTVDYTVTLGPAPGTQTFAFASTSDPTIATTFDFDARGGPATLIEIVSGDAQAATVGQAPAAPLVVKLVDSEGLAALPTALTWSSPDGGQLAEVVSTSGLDGTASAKVTLPTTAGLVRVTCEAPGVAGSPVTFALQARPAPAQRLQLVSGDGQTTTTLSRFGGAFSVRATDAFSNGVAGVPVHFDVVQGGGNVSPADTLTDATGLAQALMTAGLGGTQQYRATSDGLVGSPIVVTGNVDAPTGMELHLVSGDGQTGVAGTSLGAPLVVKVVRLGRPLQGQVVHWAVAAGDGGVVPPTSTTASDGTATTLARLGSQVGAQSFSATLPGAVGSPVLFDETATAAPPALLRAVSGAGQTAAAGGTLSAPLVVEALDASGQPLAGVTVAFAGPADGAVNPATATTDANGQAQTLATLGAATGNQTFDATVPGTSLSASFLETANGSADTLHLAITGGDGQTAEAGATLADALVVTVTNGLGAPAPNVTVTFAAVAPDARVGVGTVATDASGRAQTTATLGSALGPETFTATVDGAVGSPATFHETATEAPVDHLDVVGGDGQSALAGSALAHPLVVRAVDRAGNPKSGVAVTFRPGPAGGSLTPTSATTGADGTAQTSATLSTTVGPQTFFADSAGLASAVFTETATTAIDHLSVAPQGLQVDVRASVRYSATAIYVDGTESDVTKDATWASSNAAVATVSDAAGSKGLASALAAGSTTITASLGGRSGSTGLAVKDATLTGIVVLPASPTLAVGDARPFGATGDYSDGSTSTVTGSATWTSSAPAVATVSDAAGSKGRVVAKGVGTATITATIDGVSGTRVVTVTAAALTQLEVTPANVVEPAGTAFDFRATATYADGTVADVTAGAVWSSSDSSKLTVQNAPAEAGRATFLAPGSADVVATWQGLTARQTATITQATVVSLAVVPQRLDLSVFDVFQLGLVATYSDGTVQNGADLATWSSSDATVADVSNAAGSRGLVTAIGAGTATVTAHLGGKSASVTAHVDGASIVGLRIRVAGGGGGRGGPSCPAGTLLRLEADALYAALRPPANISDQASWTSSSPAVAVVDNGGDKGGVVQCLTEGTTTIRAEYEGQSDDVTLTVTAAVLTSIDLAPATATLARGDTTPFFATGRYSDGTQRELTNLATWSTADASIATASNAAGHRGEVTGATPGQTTVLATYDGVSGTAPVTVTDATLQFVVVTPANPVVDRRQRFEQFSATAVYSDGTTNDVTSRVAWGTTDPAVAVVSNDPQQIGWAILNGSGSCEVDASYRGMTGKTTLTVR